jgi:hypothetical protein
MTFSNNRKFTGDKNEYYELVRFATKYNIPGIANRLMKMFIQGHGPKKIVSYADRRWSAGELYYNLGFNLTKTSVPNYWYSKDGIEREHRYKFAKYKLIKEGFDPKLTEFEIMNNRKYLRIWDCGTLRFERDII